MCNIHGETKGKLGKSSYAYCLRYQECRLICTRKRKIWKIYYTKNERYIINIRVIEEDMIALIKNAKINIEHIIMEGTS